MSGKKSRDDKTFWTTLPGLLTAIAAIITAISGLLVGLSNAGLLTLSPTATPTKREWAIPYQHEFPSGFWKEGNYSYTIEASCPGTNSSAMGKSSFTVSSLESLKNESVFIRYTGLYDDKIKTHTRIDGIHPSQKTIASYTIIAQNENDIVEKLKVCKIKFIYSSENQEYTEVVLTPSSAIPYP